MCDDDGAHLSAHHFGHHLGQADRLPLLPPHGVYATHPAAGFEGGGAPGLRRRHASAHRRGRQQRQRGRSSRQRAAINHGGRPPGRSKDRANMEGSPVDPAGHNLQIIHQLVRRFAGSEVESNGSFTVQSYSCCTWYIRVAPAGRPTANSPQPTDLARSSSALDSQRPPSRTRITL